jgi:hypothetical protein
MGQKTNANIFRLGINNQKIWDSKYSENTPEEYSLYTFQHLEIKKFIERILKLNGLLLHNYKLQLSKKTLYVYISYLAGDRAISIINKSKNTKFKTLKSRKLNKNLKGKKIAYKRLEVLTKHKRYNKTTNLNNNTFLLNSVSLYIEQLLESLSIFTKRKYNITIIFQNLNKELDLFNGTKKKFIEKQKILLRQYAWNAKLDSKNPFFESSFQLLPIIITTKNSAKFLSEYIAFNLTYMKAHNFFLKFIERLLTNFINIYFSKISGIKIAIKGRFNRAQRAKTKLIIIGKIPLQTISSNIDYHQSVSFTPNGTFGVKVWICDNIKTKNKQQNVFTTKTVKI